MAMEPYSEHAATTYKLKPNNDWLICQQGLALPAIPPTTPEARQYFFSKICDFTTLANTSGKKGIDYESFAQEWNQSADGKAHFYITTEVLAAYAKTWEKTNNVQASKELISGKMVSIYRSREIFAAPQTPFLAFLTGSSNSVHPRFGVVELDQTRSIPPSLSVELAISRPSNLLSPPHQPAQTSGAIRDNVSRTSNTEGTLHASESSIAGSVQPSNWYAKEGVVNLAHTAGLAGNSRARK